MTWEPEQFYCGFRSYLSFGHKTLSLLPIVRAQDVKSRPVYRLTFSVSETDSGHIAIERKYSMVVADQNTGRVHAGVRIPYIPSENHLNMAAIGVIIECKVRSMQSDVSVECDLESSFASAKQPSMPLGFPPVIHTMQSRVSGVVPLGRQTLLSMLQDPVRSRRVEFRVTVDKL